MTINKEMQIPKNDEYIGDEMQDAVNASADFPSSFKKTSYNAYLDMFARGIQ